jgi:ferrous-iron efflux pump FieF
MEDRAALPMTEASTQKRPALMRAATYAAIAVAALLVGVKSWAYFVTGSVALLSSLADSALDLLASTLNLMAIRVALMPADSDHRFGHGKAEPLSGLGQAAFIAGSAVLVMIESATRFGTQTPVENSQFGIAVIVFSIVVTLVLVQFQKYVVRKTGSVAVGADSLHYTGDLLMNLSVIVALILSVNFELGWADPAFGVGISVFLIYNASKIAIQSVNLLMDRELPDEDRQNIRAIARKHPKVLDVHELRTRSAGLHQFIQMHIVLERDISLIEAHRISDDVEEAVRAVFPGADVIIHQDPDGVDEFHPAVGSPLH